MLVSYAFRPKTSVYNKKAAVDSAFVSPLYRGRVSVTMGCSIWLRLVFLLPFSIVVFI